MEADQMTPDLTGITAPIVETFECPFFAAHSFSTQAEEVAHRSTCPYYQGATLSPLYTWQETGESLETVDDGQQAFGMTTDPTVKNPFYRVPEEKP